MVIKGGKVSTMAGYDHLVSLSSGLLFSSWVKLSNTRLL